MRSITVIDLDARRRTKRITADYANKALNILGGGALHMSFDLKHITVIAAVLAIQYINHDGISFLAVFKIPMGTKGNEVTHSAIERVLDIREKIEKIDKLDKILTGSTFLENSPILALADSLLGKVSTAMKIMKLFSGDDSAIPIAKATAEMLAMFTQNPGFRLSYIKESSINN